MAKVAFNGTTYEKAQLTNAANAIKTAVNDKIPAAGESEQTGSASFDITVTMNDNSMVVYKLNVSWTVAKA